MSCKLSYYIYILMKIIRQSMQRFEIASHRGLGFGDENTEEALFAAAAAGFAVEYDVQATPDGVLVVVHDDTWDRTTDGTGLVSETPYPEVEKLSIRSGYNTSGASIKVPRFTDVLTRVGAQTTH